MKNKEYFVFFKDLVTQAKNGIMRKEDKIKLDNIQEEANKTIVDSALSKTSQNPVQNKVIATEIETLKKSGSDSKKNVANAITGMGVPTATDADFDTITGNIEKIGGDTTISAGDVLSGKVAYAKGKYLTGSMSNHGAKTAALDCGEYYTIPAGYHNGSGKVSANSLASQTGATAAASDILSGKTAYVNGNKITGTIPSKAAATYTPSTQDQEIAARQYLSGKQTIKGDANLVAGKIKKGASIFEVAGSFTEDANAGVGDILKEKTAYVNGSKITGTIPSKAAATYTPTTRDQEIAAGQYLSGKQTIKGDANLAAGNIKKGASIFEVAGSFTEDANAGVGDILKEKTAYVNGSKITGTIPSKAAATYTPTTRDQEIAAGQYLSGKQTIKGDANLLAANIKKGVSIFGVNGNLEANKTQVTIGSAILSRFSKLAEFNISLWDYKKSLSNSYYSNWYSCIEFEKGTSLGGTTAELYPEGNAYGAASKKPLETFLLFETGECLRLYAHNLGSSSNGDHLGYSYQSEWLNNQQPTNFTIHIFSEFEDNSLSRSSVPDDTSYVSAMGIRIMVAASARVKFYAIPIAVSGYGGPSYVMP